MVIEGGRLPLIRRWIGPRRTRFWFCATRSAMLARVGCLGLTLSAIGVRIRCSRGTVTTIRPQATRRGRLAWQTPKRTAPATRPTRKTLTAIDRPTSVWAFRLFVLLHLRRRQSWPVRPSHQ
jgi:hypothetical protein